MKAKLVSVAKAAFEVYADYKRSIDEPVPAWNQLPEDVRQLEIARLCYEKWLIVPQDARYVY